MLDVHHGHPHVGPGGDVALLGLVAGSHDFLDADLRGDAPDVVNQDRDEDESKIRIFIQGGAP